MKKLIALLTASAIMLGAGCVTPLAADETKAEGDYTYRLIDGGAEVVKYTGTDEKVRIPDSFGGQPTIRIGKRAFRSADVVKVTLPSTVKELGDHAFSDCRDLTTINLPEGLEKIETFALHRTDITKVVFPDSLKTIEGGAFEECFSIRKIKFGKGLKRIPRGLFDLTSITEVNIPDNIEHIGIGAFAECKNLKTVKIGKGVKHIGQVAFCYNTKLSKLTVSKKNKHYISVNNVLYNRKKTRLLFYPADKKDKVYTAPSSLTRIDQPVFRENKHLEEVKLSDKITEIYGSTFENAKNLKKVKLPAKLKTIGDYAFLGCRIKSVTIPKSVKYIGTMTFASNHMKSVIFEAKSKIDIRDEAFANNDFTEVTYLPFDCGYYRFLECKKLRKVNFAPGVTTIYDDFVNSGLKEITVPDTIKEITDYSLGFTEYFGSEGGYVKLKDFVINGKKNSAAHKYAKKFGIKFKAV